MPNDRSAALLYAQGLLRKGDAAGAAALLAPLAETEKDATFLETYAEALMRSGQLDAARTVLEHMTNQGAGSAEKFFSLANEYLRAGQEEKAVDLLGVTKKSMLAARRESEFASAVDQLVEAYPEIDSPGRILGRDVQRTQPRDEIFRRPGSAVRPVPGERPAFRAHANRSKNSWKSIRTIPGTSSAWTCCRGARTPRF